MYKLIYNFMYAFNDYFLIIFLIVLIVLVSILRKKTMKQSAELYQKSFKNQERVIELLQEIKDSLNKK